MPTSTLTEHIVDWYSQLHVDHSQRTVHNVALAGIRSKNGYRYREEALQNAAPLYEQKPVFLDHARDRSRPHERSTRDLVGTVINPRYDGGRLRGDIQVLDTESGRTFLALADSQAPGVGMSHVVLAERSSEDGDVERICDVISVDAVAFPATTQTFQESRSDDTAATDADNVAPALLEEQLSELQRERDSLREQLQALREREADAETDRLLQRELESSGLPAFAVTDLFRRQLREADPAGRADLLAERRTLIESLCRQRPSSSERIGRPADDATQFVAAVRRHRD